MAAPKVVWDSNQERHLLQALNNMTKAVNRCAAAIEKLNKAGEESDGSPEQAGPASPLTGDGQG